LSKIGKVDIVSWFRSVLATKPNFAEKEKHFSRSGLNSEVVESKVFELFAFIVNLLLEEGRVEFRDWKSLKLILVK